MTEGSIFQTSFALTDKTPSLIRNETRVLPHNTAVKYCFGDSSLCSQTSNINEHVNSQKEAMKLIVDVICPTRPPPHTQQKKDQEI